MGSTATCLICDTRALTQTRLNNKCFEKEMQCTLAESSGWTLSGFPSSSLQAAFFGGGASSGLMVVSRSWNPCQRSGSSHKAVSLLRPLAMLVVLENIHGIFQARILEWGAIAFSQLILSVCNCELCQEGWT